MSDLGFLSYYLGIEVKQGVNGITLFQLTYASKLLERCGLAAYNSSEMPMESRLKLSKQSSYAPVDVMGYKSIIDLLRYLLHTRLDLAFPVGYLNQFMESPQEDHLAAIKRVLRYVVGTKEHGLHYSKREEGRPNLVGYSDIDMAGDINSRKSSNGVLLFLGDNLVTWQ
jgi:hypothetical protein